jgi:hypothetical protein
VCLIKLLLRSSGKPFPPRRGVQTRRLRHDDRAATRLEGWLAVAEPQLRSAMRRARRVRLLGGVPADELPQRPSGEAGKADPRQERAIYRTPNAVTRNASMYRNSAHRRPCFYFILAADANGDASRVELCVRSHNPGVTFSSKRLSSWL